MNAAIAFHAEPNKIASVHRHANDRIVVPSCASADDSACSPNASNPRRSAPSHVRSLGVAAILDRSGPVTFPSLRLPIRGRGQRSIRKSLRMIPDLILFRWNRALSLWNRVAANE
jgi:hypothetical protein